MSMVTQGLGIGSDIREALEFEIDLTNSFNVDLDNTFDIVFGSSDLSIELDTLFEVSLTSKSLEAEV